MKFNQKEYCGKTEIIQNNDGSMVFHLSNSLGSQTLTRHSVFPGISLTYNDIQIPRSVADLSDNHRNMLEIDHCRDGRKECHTAGNTYCLAPGDMAIHLLGKGVCEEIFETGHYHGITVQIDLDKSPKCLSCFLDDVDVEPHAIAQKFQLEKNFFFALRQLTTIEHIFSELYSLPCTVQKGYLKVKILELFLFLRGLESETKQLEQRKFSQTQIVLAKNICSYLTEHIEQRITMQELSEQFGVSQSQINTSFEHVYGMSVACYMRGQRMQYAAKLLRNTDRTVLDIAGQFGYENGSKFARAFRNVMGVTPTQYRNGLYHKR